MIRSFRCRETEALFHRQASRRLPPEIQRPALRKLRMIHLVVSLQDLRILPGNRLQTLKGDRQGQCGLRINDQWPICFRWESGHAHDVEIVDYHRG